MTRFLPGSWEFNDQYDFFEWCGDLQAFPSWNLKSMIAALGELAARLAELDEHLPADEDGDEGEDEVPVTSIVIPPLAAAAGSSGVSRPPSVLNNDPKVRRILVTNIASTNQGAVYQLYEDTEGLSVLPLQAV